MKQKRKSNWTHHGYDASLKHHCRVSLCGVVIHSSHRRIKRPYESIFKVLGLILLPFCIRRVFVCIDCSAHVWCHDLRWCVFSRCLVHYNCDSSVSHSIIISLSLFLSFRGCCLALRLEAVVLSVHNNPRPHPPPVASRSAPILLSISQQEVAVITRVEKVEDAVGAELSFSFICELS